MRPIGHPEGARFICSVDDSVRVRAEDGGVDEQPLGPSDEHAGIDLASLSDREREVLELALAGLSAKAIAARLSLAEATVRSHLSRIYAKLGVAGRVELLAQVQDRPPDRRRRATAPLDGASPTPRRLGRRSVAALAITFLALAGGLAFVVVRPDLPPRTDLAAVAGLVSGGQVASLDLHGDTLLVTTTDGRRFRVEGADPAAIRTLQTAAIAITPTTVSVSGGGDTLATTVAMIAISFVPPALVLVAMLLAVRWLRRPPRPKPVG